VRFLPRCQVSPGALVSQYVRRLMTLLAAMALLTLGLPAVATAQGNGGVDEYEEVLPGPGGGNESSGGGDEGDDSSGPLPPAQVSALEEQGSDGAAAAELARQTGSDHDRGSGDPLSATADVPDDRSGVAEVVGDLAGGSGGGMGIVLPIVLVAALVGAIAFVVARRRGGRADPA